MEKAKNVIDYYMICNKLKNTIRTGWKDWNVQKERLESVAEHIYGTQMLALAINSEYEYDIDITKVIMMLAIHELEETVIGDLTHFQITKEEKEKLGHEAVNKILKGLTDGEKLKQIIYEFDERQSKEAKFAYFCDKLEADIQSKIYDEEGFVDLNNQPNNISINDNKVKELLQNNLTFSEMWLKYSSERYDYDDNFKEISNYVLNNKIIK